MIGRTGDGRLICAHHGTECIQSTFDRPSRAGLRPGQENKEHKFRLKGQCLKCAREGSGGQKSIRAMFDWSNFTHYPHHAEGRPDLHAYREAMLVRLNQVESAFGALKADNRTGAAGTDRPRVRYAATYQALLSLAHLGRAALVIADQRQQRDDATTAGTGSALLKPPRGTRSYPARPRRRPGRRRQPVLAPVAGVPRTPDPAAQALLNRGRATKSDPPAWAA